MPPSGPHTALPTELYHTLNYVHFLHVLSVNPGAVVPPGKSLLSVLSRPYTHGGQQADLRKRVENIVHKAFWEQTFELLSDPTPSVQLARLKELLADLHTAVKPLLPEKHPLLTILSLPLPPTSNVLHSVLDPLRETLRALRSRCAPIHDDQLDHLIQTVEDPLDRDLPRIIVDVSRNILGLCEQMKADLMQFTMGNMGETQLHEAIMEESERQEKQMIGELWGLQKAKEVWNTWLDAIPQAVAPLQNNNGPRLSPSRARFIRRLTSTLGMNHAATCPLPATAMTLGGKPPNAPHKGESPFPSDQNAIPPLLFFEIGTLIYLQNYLQALVIAAALRALVRLPPQSHINGTHSSELDFEERVWLILKDDFNGEPSPDGVKLVNLADEVVRVSRTSKGDVIDAAEEARLRAAVNRTLQPNDPVFMLLHKRLLQAVQARLLKGDETPHEGRESGSVPKFLQSGRRVPGTPARSLLRKEYSITKADNGRPDGNMKISVKGFEHPVIAGAVNEALSMIENCVNWTERVWGNLFV
ncbi:hypothetical protein BDY19DRAFT_882863 [Irpex rosettiformis]|uniref:Uncharacterized protein n=1 Tax=Irpex rosettiformis TaxID=378272 RepID=A0ACB8UH82_9APHY|nr:hypothetical protein BDY19DRAFT_882863 [Irpex rosettiformis]